MCISNIKKQYAATPYDFNNIDNIQNEHLHFTINPQLFFEILLLEIRSRTISFSAALKKKENSLLKNLENEIRTLENNDPVINFDLIKSKQDELILLRENKLKGMLVRSRARWLESGEKPTNFFCNLENRHFVSKRMKTLIIKNENETNNLQEIENEVLNFYSKLYQSNEHNIKDVNISEILDETTPTLTETDSMSIEGKLTLEEAGKFLKNMKNNKSPGSSGFSVEFFKFFWKDLGIFLVNSINFGFENRELSSTQKEGIITCIPKFNKCKKYIKNWRPISLLNVTYKIASGCIANRIKTVLPSLINLDQSGFMSNRFTGDNIRLMYDILHFSKVENKRGLLLLIDFEKAFDSIAWSFINKTLLYFKFKNDIIQWIQTFYNNIKSTVIVNNKPTSWFQIHRGCRQGDPISPYLFLLCGEVLAHMIRQKKEIKGFVLFDKEVKISQFADDTSLFLDGSKESFQYCIETILEYTKYSGLAMNNEKTKVIWFGCQNPPNTVYLPQLNFHWNPETFTLLGIDFTIDLKNITDKNINKKLNEITMELNQWSKRDLTPFGKITVLKSLIISKIVHILISLPTPTPNMMTKLNKLFYNFLWGGKPDPVKRTTSRLKLIDGGLGMLDLYIFDKALKLTWIKRFFYSSTKWKTIVQIKYPELNAISNFGDTFLEKITDITNPFWENVFKYYVNFYKIFKIKTSNQLKMTSFLYNSKICVGKKTIKNRNLIDNNVFFIGQLLKPDNTFLTLQELNTKYSTHINFLQYNSIKSSITEFTKTISFDKHTKKTNFQPPLDIILTTRSGTSPIYKAILTPEHSCNGLKKWSKHTEISEEDWIDSFQKLIVTTTDPKLRWIQYRILHNILTTNRSVSKFIQHQTDLCSFCNRKSETIVHLFWECPKTNLFWKELQNIFNNRCLHSFNFKFTKNLVFFGHCEKITTDKICDFIILMAKFFIYRCKVQGINLNIKHFINELYNRYNIELIISKNKNQCKCDWAPYQNIFKSFM